MKSSVVQELVVDAHVYLRWVLGAAARNAAPHQNPSLQAPEARAGGLKKPPQKKTMLKIGPLKTKAL